MPTVPTIDPPESATEGRIQFTGEQRRIVRSADHAAQVQAFAGSGKTTTLALSVERDIKKGVLPEDILCLTFSKAARDVARGRLPAGVKVQTFHSMTLSLAQRPGQPLKLLDAKTAEHLLGQAVKKVQKRRKEQGVHRSAFLDRLVGTKANRQLGLRFFDLVRAGGQSPKKLVRDHALPFSAFTGHLRSLRKVAERYWKAMECSGLIDYAGMIQRGLRVVETGTRLRFTHLYVDEYQDCTPAQARLIATLAPHMQKVRVFGDRFQAIYGFAGARFTDLATLIPGAKTYSLTKSFRLTVENAALASAVLGQYKGADSPHIVSGRGTARRPTLHVCGHAHEQGPVVVGIVRDLLSRGVSGSEIAILARTKAQLREQEQALLAKGIETRPLYRHRGTRHVRRVVLLAKRVQQLRNLTPRARREQLRERLRKSDRTNALKPKTREAHRRRLEGVLRSPSFQSLFAECARTYLAILQARRGRADTNAVASVNRVVAAADGFRSAKEFERRLARAERSPHVQTSTMHQAKGGEWNHVILLNVVDGCMPLFRAGAGDTAIDEERNLFYVGITRARQELHLIHAPYANARVKTVFSKPTRYLRGAASRCLVTS